jgi:hypothetical protein
MSHKSRPQTRPGKARPDIVWLPHLDVAVGQTLAVLDFLYICDKAPIPERGFSVAESPLRPAAAVPRGRRKLPLSISHNRVGLPDSHRRKRKSAWPAVSRARRQVLREGRSERAGSRSLLVLASGGDFGVNQDARVALSSAVRAQEPLCLNGTLCVSRIRFGERVPGRTGDRTCSDPTGQPGMRLRWVGVRLQVCAGPWCWRKNRIISAEELGPCASV